MIISIAALAWFWLFFIGFGVFLFLEIDAAADWALLGMAITATIWSVTWLFRIASGE